MQTRTHSLTRYAQCARSLAHLTIYIMCDGNIFATTTMLGVEAGGWWVGGGRRCGEAGDATNAQHRGDGSAGAHVQIWSSNPNKSRKPICQSFLCRTFFCVSVATEQSHRTANRRRRRRCRPFGDCGRYDLDLDSEAAQIWA